MDTPAPTAQDQNLKSAASTNFQQTSAANATNTVPQQAQNIPTPDLNAFSQADLANIPLQGLPTDMGLLPMMPQDGGLLTDEQLMNMPLMPMMMDGSNMLNIPQAGMTNDEIALYDRQIRLWGMQAQQKIRNANVLLITMKALGNEIAKNLVLAGIGSLTVVDHENVTEADLGSQFLVSQEQVGANRAQACLPELQKLNPRVNVIVDMDDVRLKGPSYFALFDMVIATDLDPDTLNIINTATRFNIRPFYAAGVHGLYGFIFADLIEHNFVIEREKPNVATQPKAETKTRLILDVQTRKEGDKTIEVVSKKEMYSTWLLASDGAFLPEDYTKSKRRLRAVSPALSCLRALWDFQSQHGGRIPADKNDLAAFTRIATQKHKDLSLPGETLTAEFLRSFLQNIGCELAPVTAILGGQLAQDVINVLGQTQQPIQNMIIFDGNQMEANLYPLHPPGPLGAAQLMSSLPGLPGMGAADMNGFGIPDASMMNMGMPPMDVSLEGMGTVAGAVNLGMMGNAAGATHDKSAANHTQ
ncbi:hypothetical protein BD289DRAFT_450049 [Coniella lustricola]|uniref:Ubiquitin-like 1-activating enzyme E1A n=1 Tax=Coniella lustricola TaxID=2025994 RepID=A0A2T3AKB7_9PEZI|nr:hypothetical protein BD289DRAFT_450049 [Coniella lustricola]